MSERRQSKSGRGQSVLAMIKDHAAEGVTHAVINVIAKLPSADGLAYDLGNGCGGGSDQKATRFSKDFDRLGKQREFHPGSDRQEVAEETSTTRRKKSPRDPGLLGLCEIERGAAFSAPGAPRPSSFRYADINRLNIECRCPGTFPRLLTSNLPHSTTCHVALQRCCVRGS